MKKRRVTVTIDPVIWEELRAMCKRLHYPRPNLSASVQEAVVLWLDLKRTRHDKPLLPSRPGISKPAIRLCRGPQFSGCGCDQWTTIPVGETSAPCRHCGKKVNR